MTLEEVKQQLESINDDINYFKKLDFQLLVEKFERDKRVIESLLKIAETDQVDSSA